MFSGPDQVGTTDGGFADELSRLKRRGASVLVVGSVHPDQWRDACRRLLGCGTDRTRRRVLVSTTAGPHHAIHHVDETGSEALSVIAYDAQARNATTAEPGETPSIRPATTEAESLADLGIAIEQAIENFETNTAALESGEVRLGIDSLLPLLEEYGRQRVFKLLHLVNGRTKAVDGMAHYHLPVERDARIVQTLSPLFDIIVELREHDGDYQERWTIEDGDRRSGWLSVGPE
ncbi:hypothetical protein A6E15_14930 [Natrinema saccharevitans]|uniref:KaiC-like domain-containing protein n=1 Tax=Natrinema saccharevitans TaxID=301967 RepID=A0A1S8AZU5_9EURY|nr:hypothetical protein [Natrinema saccharevitans]OLZ42182.1 hypothetical protein A6E15_14930 [Natrinema saccharevitans]